MTTPWLGDACSLVDAFRARELSPVEALEASLAAIDASALNAFCHLDVDAARAAAAAADVTLPFGGVPVGVKELERVAGWPLTEASLALADEVATVDGTQTARMRRAGAVLVGQTTASEFGGVNYTSTKLHGTTGNPWSRDRTPGGSSGGAAAAVAGGLVPIGSGSDGGGSIRIPASFCGLVGLKPTFGRIPKGPLAEVMPLTSVLGCLSRSVRDTARWLDVCSGFDARDPYSIPRVDGWEAGLGAHDLTGKRAVISPTLGAAFVDAHVEEVVAEAAEVVAKAAGLTLVDVPVQFPEGSVEWALAGAVSLQAMLGARYPECEKDLTFDIAFIMRVATQAFGLEQAAAVERYRQRVNEAIADLFEQVDFVLSATTPDVAFAAEGPMPTRVNGADVGFGNNLALTGSANISGIPAISVPAGTVDGLPVGLQVQGRHHEEALLLELALVAERERPWPLVAPGAPL